MKKAGLLLIAILGAFIAVPASSSNAAPLCEDDVCVTESGFYGVTANGGVYASGNAKFAGSAGNIRLNSPIVGLEQTDEESYYLVAADGGVFSYGNAEFMGSAGNIKLNSPIVDMLYYGDGYMLVAADGGVFAYGSQEHFEGSLGNTKLNAPIIGAGVAPEGGYWLAAADGGVFTFGDATFHGSLGGQARANKPLIRDMTTSRTGDGYLLLDADGGVYAFGDAPFKGTAASKDEAASRHNAKEISLNFQNDGYIIATQSPTVANKFSVFSFNSDVPEASYTANGPIVDLVSTFDVEFLDN